MDLLIVLAVVMVMRMFRLIHLGFLEPPFHIRNFLRRIVKSRVQKRVRFCLAFRGIQHDGNGIKRREPRA